MLWINIFMLPLPYTVFFIIAAFILGAVIGSFLNVVILRVPRHEKISGIGNRSHCMSCGQTLKNIDLIPIFSYIFLGGKCRFCKAKISPRYWIVELTTALCYTASVCLLGLSIFLPFALILFPVLIVASGIDIDQMQIPYTCSIIVAVLGVLATILDTIIGGTPWYDHLLGAVVVGVPFALMAMFGAMGGGDFQLMTAAGLLLGWSAVPAAGIGIVLGALGGSITLLTVPKGKKKEINEKLSGIVNEWYAGQVENGAYVAEGKSDVIFGSMFKGKSDIEPNCISEKLWSAKPDIDALNARLNEELSDVSKFSISAVIEGQKVKSVSGKKQIVFGPYISVGIAAGFFFGGMIIQWYLGFIR